MRQSIALSGLMTILLTTTVGAQSPTFDSGSSESEILRIREQMRAEGHGLPTYLPHFYLNGEFAGEISNAEFAGEIQRLSSQDRGSNFAQPAQQQFPDLTPNHNETKRLLRETAFQLDTLAHRLEMQDLVGQADQLRHVARQLRADARGEGHDHGPAPGLPPRPARPEGRRSDAAPLFFPGGGSDRRREKAAEEPMPALREEARPREAPRRERDRPRGESDRPR